MNPLWTCQEITQALALGPASQPFEATGVSIDTRTLVPGDLFVALKGPMSDGNDYIKDAFARGAAGALVSRGGLDQRLGPQILVDDTCVALNDLARFARKRAQARVGAVTGSFGKTSCKDALYNLLSKQGATTASQSSFNNHWGVPLSLARLHAQDKFGIFEVGTNKPGEISPLSHMLRPHVALVTTVEPMHMVHMETVEAVAHEKASLFFGVEAGGRAVLNRDNPHFELLEQQARQKGLEVLSFGTYPEAFARLLVSRLDERGLQVEARIDGQPFNFHIPVFQAHWAMNALGVLAAVWALGANVEQAAQDFNSFVLPEGRGVQRIIALPCGGTFTLIDESYNAGPLSMKAAIETLGLMQPGPQGRRLAVLAEMLELGPESAQEHEKLLPLLEAAGVDCVFTLGDAMRPLREIMSPQMRAFHGEDNACLPALSEEVIAHLRPGDIIMLKGSRGRRAYRGRLSDVVDALKNLEHSKKEQAS